MSEPDPLLPRFWLPMDPDDPGAGAAARMSAPRVVMDGPYLLDPGKGRTFNFNPHVVTTDQVATTPCAVLLGEAGLGKTTSMKRLRGPASSPGIVWVDMSVVGTPEGLHSKLFGHSQFAAWAEGRSPEVQVFIDNLDLGILRVDAAAGVLVEGLNEAVRQRGLSGLSLRIACRPGRWPPELERALREAWGKDGVQVFTLLPLRRQDAAMIAQAAVPSLDVDAFHRALDEADAHVFAARPLMLDMLLRLHVGEGLPRSSRTLYERGTMHLSENLANRKSDSVGELTAAQRRAVAARVAACTMFGGQAGVWRGLEGNAPAGALPLSTLAHQGPETAQGEGFTVSENALKETLDTGLFDAGPRAGMVTWAHPSYEEFLAAYYLHHKSFSLRQVQDLLCLEADAREVVPRFSGVAGWLASMNGDFQDWVLKQDPLLLLRTDPAAVDDATRARVVDAIMDALEEGTVAIGEVRRGRLDNLAHPELASQLRPRLMSASSQQTRTACIVILARAGANLATPDLLHLALEPGEDPELRSYAVTALDMLDDQTSLERLRVILDEPPERDPQDEVFGAALDALWPHHVCTQDVLDRLRPPQNPRRLGTYWAFLLRMGREIPTSDLPTALEWARDHVPPHPREADASAIHELSNRFLVRGWENIAAPGVLAAFARAAWARMRQHRPFLRPLGDDSPPGSSNTLSDAVARRSVLQEIVGLCEDPDADAGHIRFSVPALVGPDDLEWLIEQYQQAETHLAKDIYCHLFQWCHDPANSRHVDALLTVYAEGGRAAAILGHLFDAVELESKAAQAVRHAYSAELEFQREQGERAREQEESNEKILAGIRALLSASEAGDPDAWWRLTRDFSLEEGGFPGDARDANLSQRVWWEKLTVQERERLLDAAQRWLINGDPGSADWAGSEGEDHRQLGGYKALRLLHDLRPAFVEGLDGSIWERWALAVVAQRGHADYELRAELARRAHAAAPSAFRSAFLTRLDVELARQHGVGTLTALLRNIHDPELQDSILERLRSREVGRPDDLDTLLGMLIRRAHSGAFAFALDLTRGSGESARRARALWAARALFLNAPNEAWDALRATFQDDPAFGAEVLGKVEDRFSGSSEAWRLLTAETIAGLYEWLVSQFPPQKDAPESRTRGFAVTPSWALPMWRDRIPRELTARGTPDATHALERLAQAHPHLHPHVIEARRVLLLHAWTPAAPQHVLAMARRHTVRVVNSPRALLDVVLESLERLQAKLVGEIPAAPDLWNECYNPTKRQREWRHKDEHHLSDYVARHLRDDLKERGIIANREVQINRRDRTDIRVEAVTLTDGSSPGHSVSVIIETKGDWNGEPIRAMETQLRDRYLRPDGTTHGLYLIGWFGRGSDCHTRRSRQLASYTIDSLQAKLDEQARSLTAGGLHLRAWVLDVPCPARAPSAVHDPHEVQGA